MLVARSCWSDMRNINSEKDRLEMFWDDFLDVKLVTKKEERERIILDFNSRESQNCVP